MNASIRFATILPVTALLLTGCTNSGSVTTWSGKAMLNTPTRSLHEDRASAPSLDAGTNGLAYATDRPAPHAMPEARFESPRRPQHQRLVGLYGELIDRPSPSAGQFDGAGNLAQITVATEGACFDPSTTRDGSTLAFASTQHRPTADIFVKSTKGRTITQITSDPADDVMPVFAPDQHRIAFASNREGNWNIYITSLDGGAAIQVTDSPEHDLHPTWSPDGTKVAYCKLGTHGRWELWVVDLENRVHQFLEYGLFPQWNPDPSKSKIAFQRARERGSRLFSVWTIDYIDGEAMHPTEIVSAANAAAMHPSWSPTGDRLAFVTVLDPDHTGSTPKDSDIWVIDLHGTNRTNLTNGRHRNLYPEWAADGTVYFLSDRSGVDNIWAVATGRTIELANRTSGRAFAEVGPDAGHLRSDP